MRLSFEDYKKTVPAGVDLTGPFVLAGYALSLVGIDHYIVVDENDDVLLKVELDDGDNWFSSPAVALEAALGGTDDDDSPEYDGLSDAEADADVLASAGYGTDEDYGYFGE